MITSSMAPQVHRERDAERGHRCFFTCLSGAFPEFTKWGGTGVPDIQAYMQSCYFILSMSSFCFLLLFCCQFYCLFKNVPFFVICTVYIHATCIEYNHRRPLFAGRSSSAFCSPVLFIFLLCFWMFHRICMMLAPHLDCLLMVSDSLHVTAACFGLKFWIFGLLFCLRIRGGCSYCRDSYRITDPLLK